MDRFVHDRTETIVFPGWGVPRELYFDALDQTSLESVDIVDYGFFNDEESPLYTPIFDQEEDIPPVIVGGASADPRQSVPEIRPRRNISVRLGAFRRHRNAQRAENPA